MLGPISKRGDFGCLSPRFDLSSYGTVRIEIIENDTRTSRISGFGSGGESKLEIKALLGEATATPKRDSQLF